MPTYLKKKIPWLKVILVIMAIAFIIVVIGFAVPGAGAMMIGGITGAATAVYEFFFVTPSAYSVLAAIGITAAILILIFGRKYFFKQKISDSSVMQTAPPQLQSGLINTSPLAATPMPQQILSDSKQEVTTSA